MFLRSFKIPLSFLIIGFIWAFFSHPLISVFDKDFSPEVRELCRSLNHLVFVAVAAIVLYFQIKKQQNQLLASEEQYRNLFERNPSPMWIFRDDNLSFVKVNRAATRLYGYSESEFLSMSVKDIRPEKEVGRFMNTLKSIEPGLSDQGVWKHHTKKGELIYASITTSDINFDNNYCRLAMATNITDTVLKEERIKLQNAALHEIAWLNSHEVRKSLCSVISLIELLKDTTNELERRQYIQMLEQCTAELDEVLMRTNKRVDELKQYDSPRREPVY